MFLTRCASKNVKGGVTVQAQALKISTPILHRRAGKPSLEVEIVLVHSLGLFTLVGITSQDIDPRVVANNFVFEFWF